MTEQMARIAAADLAARLEGREAPTAAADVLGVEDVELFSYPEGHLPDVPLDELGDLLDTGVGAAEALLVFDEGGVSGHPDHRLVASTRSRRR